MQKVYKTQNSLKSEQQMGEWKKKIQNLNRFHNACGVSTYLMQNALQIDSVRFSIQLMDEIV